ncbi:MAG: hypothetical protein ACQEXV_23740 [Bacillota bacterium]
MTEQEADEFTTALSERYAEIQKNNSYNNELINIWNNAIGTLPPEIKHGFEEKYDHLVRESSS